MPRRTIGLGPGLGPPREGPRRFGNSLMGKLASYFAVLPAKRKLHPPGALCSRLTLRASGWKSPLASGRSLGAEHSFRRTAGFPACWWRFVDGERPERGYQQERSGRCAKT